MHIAGRRILPVGRERAWSALTDPQLLRSAIPGCESVERTTPERYVVVMAAALGPVKARFQGRLDLEDVVVAERYRMRFEGEGAAAGFARGTADVLLSDDEGGTRVDYEAHAQVGGRIAQVGSRLVDPAARKFVEDFFTAFERLIR
ncbi:MAG TPA: carbon monoxide dehydrogenase subunit G [Usitatibacter sp.]|nr:carbon monoxide dehydrogenase subunit G [Usitatibacter sp.]